jgi:hypothetical protein
MQTKKVIIITSVLMVAAVGVAYAVTRKKSNPIKTAARKVTKIIIGDSMGTDQNASSALKQGSSGQYVEWLQELLNEVHDAAAYQRQHCGGFFPVMNTGMPLQVNGIFDSATALAAQYYLQSQQIEISDLLTYRDQIKKYQAGDDKCKYPLSY